jgi:hypothetical protein
MTKAELVKLGFNKIFIDDSDDIVVTNNYFYELSFGELIFISGDRDQMHSNDKGWYVTTPCQSLKFHHFTELQNVINIFERNKI